MLWLLIVRLMTVIQANFLEEGLVQLGLWQHRDIRNGQAGGSAAYCGKVPKNCEASKYRSYDGSCNNLAHGWWGKSHTPYIRLLDNTYSDGIGAFPKSISGKDLPNPRTCSLRLYVDFPNPDDVWNLAFMQVGQIIAHDISLTEGVAQTNSGGVMCCFNGTLTEAARTNPRCAPIPIPEDDPYNAPEGITCMNFFRTETTKDLRNCVYTTKVAEPLTAVTSNLDVSYIYGSNKTTAMKMRKGKGGKLKFVIRNGRELLTQDPNPTFTCNVKSSEDPCYFAGDIRVNQNPQLALLHNLFLIQHNSIADALAEVNPHWDDETLFQEVRRIVIAKHQYVTYYEFLPILIGKDHMIKHKLIYPNATGFIRDYDLNVNSAASIEFSSNAFRFFHTEIEGSILSYNENRNISGIIRLSDWLNRPSVCEHGKNFKELTIGLATQAQSAEDRFYSNEVLNSLFKFSKIGLGLDLRAIDIQRARDHGSGTYRQALKYFGLSDPKSFRDFTKYIKPEYVETLKDLYESYLDVDLAVGLSLEDIQPGTLCGATTQAIITEQFRRTRRGDYFFFENGNGIHPFTIEQLAEIKKTTFASFLCFNPEIEQMQAHAFQQVCYDNPLKLCSDIHRFDATAWKDMSAGSN